MANSVYAKMELVGTSTESITAAIAAAAERAAKTVKNPAWFEVVEQRGAFRDGKVEYQVTICVGYKME